MAHPDTTPLKPVNTQRLLNVARALREDALKELLRLRPPGVLAHSAPAGVRRVRTVVR